MTKPKIIDNDRGLITANVNGHRVRDWIYANDTERRRYMLLAREYVEGWCDGADFIGLALEPFSNAAKFASTSGRPCFEFVGADDYERARQKLADDN